MWIFENDEGEAFKLQLFVDGNHVTEFFVNREDKINRGSLPIDYRVELQDEVSDYFVFNVLFVFVCVNVFSFAHGEKQITKSNLTYPNLTKPNLT